MEYIAINDPNISQICQKKKIPRSKINFNLSLSIQVLLWLLGSTEALAELASTKSCKELVDPNGDNFCPRSGSSSWVVLISIEKEQYIYTYAQWERKFKKVQARKTCEIK